MPKLWTPRVAKNFVLQKVSTDFVWKELTKLKLTKATGLDGLTAKRLRDEAPVMAKPITYLVNLTISTGVIPSEWKDARVTPNFKSGERNDENNYRPISILPLVSKVMERAVQVQFFGFFDCTGFTFCQPIRFSQETLHRNGNSLSLRLYFRSHG